MILQKELLHHFECKHLSRGTADGGLDVWTKGNRRLR